MSPLSETLNYDNYLAQVHFTLATQMHLSELVEQERYEYTLWWILVGIFIFTCGPIVCCVAQFIRNTVSFLTLG